MRLFDSHCHFETDDETQLAALLTRAKTAGVEALLAVGGSAALSRNAARAAAVARTLGAAAPAVVCAFGIDRDQTNASAEDRALAAAPLDAPTPVAIGEIGLDYHYTPETRDAQLALVATQLDDARRRNLPVVIHTREAATDTRALLTEIPSRGIIHCFTGSPDEARAYLDLGFYISISGIVTFRSAENVRQTARFVPDDRLLIETDAPYLAPVPLRGQPNEPAFICHTCTFLANLRGLSPTNLEGLSPNSGGLSPESLADLTFANAKRALGL